MRPQNVQLQNVQLQNVSLPNVQLQTVQDTNNGFPDVHTVKKVSDIPFPSRDVPYQTLPGRTVCKMNLILRSIERRPQMQFSMARKFKLQQLRRYSVKPSKMCKYAPHLAYVYASAARKFTHILRISRQT